MRDRSAHSISAFDPNAVAATCESFHVSGLESTHAQSAVNDHATAVSSASSSEMPLLTS
jgi:hypothetical protein